ncbi:sortase [Streptomyces sp. SL13]|uniref:Sortase n=1 Tax=Streptantibioticus silvisoli TaxID=2705255 RepID=A0AA90JY29_9ACTN|nr:sortase [Streptantibioticus silvisoli]MDI5970751.1 sortase [Streptantibioticus silvisoli]
MNAVVPRHPAPVRRPAAPVTPAAQHGHRSGPRNARPRARPAPVCGRLSAHGHRDHRSRDHRSPPARRPGAAIIVGHVDSLTGPAAFYGLSTLRPGDEISIDRADGTRATFTVRALRQYDKDTFPDDEVYAATGTPSLRLITCGGTYDRRRAEYRADLVVHATGTTGRTDGTAPPSALPHRSGN